MVSYACQICKEFSTENQRSYAQHIRHCRNRHNRQPPSPDRNKAPEPAAEEISYEQVPSERSVAPPPPQIQGPAGDSIDALLDSQILDPKFKMRNKPQPQEQPSLAQQQPQKVVYVNSAPQQQQDRNIPLETAILGVTQILGRYLEMKTMQSSGPSFWEKTGPKLFENYYMNLTKERGRAVGKKLPNDDAAGAPDILMDYMQEQEKRIKQLESNLSLQRDMAVEMDNVPSEHQRQPEPERHTHKNNKKAKR